jgi:hypothetical protein
LESKCRGDDNKWDINKNKDCTQLKSQCENCSGCTAPTPPPPPPSPTPSTGDCTGKKNLDAATDCCKTKINSNSYCNPKDANVISTCHDPRTPPGPDVNCSFTGPSPPPPPTPGPPTPPGPSPGPPPPPTPGPPTPPGPSPGPPPPPTPGPPSKSSNHVLYITLGVIGGLILLSILLYFYLPK